MLACIWTFLEFVDVEKAGKKWPSFAQLLGGTGAIKDFIDARRPFME